MAEFETLAETPNYTTIGKSHLISANIGRRYWKTDWRDDRCKDADYALALRRYAREMPDMAKIGLGLILWGEHGAGKTASACRMLIEAMARAPVRCFFIHAADITWYAGHRNELTPEGERVWDLLVCDARFLVIDDIGAEDDADWKAPDMEHVLSCRYDNQLTTFLTTNLKPDDLYAHCPRVRHLANDCFQDIEVKGVTWRG